MTIYTHKIQEKKEESDILEPQVVTDPLLEVILLSKPEKKDEVEVALSPPLLVAVAMQQQRRRGSCANICMLLTALIVLATGILGGIYLYKHLAHRTFTGWCGVRYYEFQERERLEGQHRSSSFLDGRRRQRHYGYFEEHVEIDKIDGKFERIDIPEFETCQRSTIMHDFEKNMTAIVDKDHYRCFLMPLNRTIVQPPSDFFDMIGKLASGYYMPDVEVVRDTYHVVQPLVRNLSPYGYYIWRECHQFNTFRLEIDTEPNGPVAMVKRSVDDRWIQFANGGGKNYLQIMKINIQGIM